MVGVLMGSADNCGTFCARCGEQLRLDEFHVCGASPYYSADNKEARFREARELRELRAEVERLREENSSLKQDANMSWECVQLVRERLKALEPDKSKDIDSIPPMSFDDWAHSIIARMTRDARADRDAARADLREALTLLRCRHTGKLCGTETWPEGFICPCAPCAFFVAKHKEAGDE